MNFKPKFPTSGKDGGGWDSYGARDGHVHTAVFKMDHQQGPTVHHREPCATLCGSPGGKGVWVRMSM